MELTIAKSGELLATLGERLRLRMACCLVLAKDGLCVCELVDALQISQPNVSQHLRLMKAADLVIEERREGRWVYYQFKDLDHPILKSIHGCLEKICCCADLQEDLRRLRERLKLRRNGKCVVGVRRKTRR
jgi:ArsR family transcriptional regulator, arsenate/arsenite/antimonite-responsive transcriptional repressor